MLMLAFIAVLVFAFVVVRWDAMEDGERFSVGLRYTSIRLVYEYGDDPLADGRMLARFAAYDWSFNLRFEAIWTIYGFVVTVCR